MGTAKQDMMRLLESLPDDASLADIHSCIEAARDQFDQRVSLDGISRFTGKSSELDGKVVIPGGLQVAQWEGLGMFWDYEEAGNILSLVLIRGDQQSDPVLQIPLAEEEIQLFRDCQEEGGWGYYELKVDANDARAAVNVSLITTKRGPVSLLWFLDRQRRAAVKRAINRFVSPPLLAE